MFKLVFYDRREFTSFLDGLPSKLKAKVGFYLNRLEIEGNALREPYSKPLVNGIFELRLKQSSNIARIFYFFDKGKIIVITNAYFKQSQKLDRRYLLIAQARRKEYIKSNEIQR